jgi:hypothetical protein
MTIRGHCLCGQITWTLTGPFLWSGHCHCDSCRRACSAPYTSFVGAARRDVVWGGEMAVRRTSDGQVQRGFCASCGSQMYYHSDTWPDETHLYVATMVDPTPFRPQAHFHYAERLPSTQITDDLPKYPGGADITQPL